MDSVQAMEGRITRLGPLTCRVVQEKGAVEAPALTVVLCHGFGAPGDDLVGLVPPLLQLQPSLQRGVRFVFPEAPLSLEEYGGANARAWWRIDLERRIRAQQLGAEARSALMEEVPEGLGAARKMLLALVEELSRQPARGGPRLVLGGFSQGAMLATDVALSMEEAPAALVVLSGTLLARPDWTRKAPRRRGLRVFQSHGRSDGILPFSAAEELRGVLEKGGLEVDFHPFEGEHAIPGEVLQSLGAFLARLPPGS